MRRVGGAGLPEEYERRFAPVKLIWWGYGMTEMAPVVAVNRALALAEAQGTAMLISTPYPMTGTASGPAA